MPRCAGHCSRAVKIGLEEGNRYCWMERFIRAHKKKACVRWEARGFLGPIWMQTTTHPCIMFIYAYFVSTLSICLSSICVRLPLLLCFSLQSTCHRWISRRSPSPSPSVWFPYFHFPPAWRSYFPLNGRKKNKNTFTLLLSIEMASKIWTKTLQIWSRGTFSFFPITFWIRVRGGNWKRPENCFLSQSVSDGNSLLRLKKVTSPPCSWQNILPTDFILYFP